MSPQGVDIQMSESINSNLDNTHWSEYYKKAVNLYRQNSDQLALENVIKSINQEQNQVNLRLLADIYYKNGQLENAIKFYEQIIAITRSEGNELQHTADLFERKSREVMDNYQRGWNSVYNNIKKEIVLGEGDLSRALSQFRVNSDLSHDHFTGKLMPLNNNILSGSFTALMYQLTSQAYKDYHLSQFCQRNNGFDWIVELGSGCGNNLCKIWTTVGTYDAKYIAAEFTNEGRKTASLLGTYDNNLNLISKDFDYNCTDLSQIIPEDGLGIVFSQYSIEQIPHLRDDFITSLSSYKNIQEVMHIEPITWQLDGILNEPAVINPEFSVELNLIAKAESLNQN